MRCDASDDCVGNCDSAASAAPVGGLADVRAPATPPSATAATAAITQLTERSATLFVEEVEVLRIDCDRHEVAELQLDVRRERGHEVRTRADDARRVLTRELVRVGDRLRLDLARVHLEV